MKTGLLARALALGVVASASPALADDPRDAAMRSDAARARDRAIVKRLNQQQLAHVRERDARYAKEWKAQRAHAGAQAEYERKMAAWRRAVAACKAGRLEFCGR